MSDFIQYTQWKQREEAMPRELEHTRVTAERLAEDLAARRAARRKGLGGHGFVAAFHAIRRATRRLSGTGEHDEPAVTAERQLAHRR